MAISSVSVNGHSASKITINGGVWFQKDSSPSDAYNEYMFRIDELSIQLTTFEEDINNDSVYMPGDTLDSTYRTQSSGIRDEVTLDASLTESERQSLFSALGTLDQKINDVGSVIQYKTVSAEDNYNIALENYNAAVQQVYDNVYIEEGDYQSPTVQGYIEEARIARESLSNAITLYNMYVGYAETPEFPF